MKPKSTSAFTKVDLAILVAVASGFALWIVFATSATRRERAHSEGKARVRCTGNLKNLTLAYALWGLDQDMTNLPWEVTAPPGTALHARSSGVVPHFATLSNQLQSLQSLTCPADYTRKPAGSWSALQNTNISYFINFTPSADLSAVIAGDHNLSTNGDILMGPTVIADVKKLKWTKAIHNHRGNIATIDGSAHQLNTPQLRLFFTNTPIHLAFP